MRASCHWRRAAFPTLMKCLDGSTAHREVIDQLITAFLDYATQTLQRYYDLITAQANAQLDRWPFTLTRRRIPHYLFTMRRLWG
jgi:hypothetical protein